MTFYLVKAKPKSNIDQLRQYMDKGMIYTLIPFGKSLQFSLENARIDESGNALWIEEDYCSPPLAMEREAVLDQYFDDIQVQVVSSEEQEWDRIKSKQTLWNNTKSASNK